MKYTGFNVKNYKGVIDEDIELGSGEGGVYTCVGINESGKTTILDGIELLNKKVSKGLAHTFIPKSRKHNFSGAIEVSANILLNEQDRKKIQTFFEGKRRELVYIDDQLTLTRKFLYTKGEYKGQRYDLVGKISIKTKGKEGKTSDLTESKNAEIEKEFKEFVKESKPPIVYYRNFLFEFPKKIYLEDVPKDEDEETQSFYVAVVQDILDSLSKNPDERLQISELVERIQSDASESTSALDAATKKMAGKIADEISKTWDKLFEGGRNKKTIEIKAFVDQETTPTESVIDYPYLSFTINEGSEPYEVGERSLGFRWFFVFLLFTTFRKNRSVDEGEILFLLDEPASNLHSTAQAELLRVLEKLGIESKLIYTTHSHHLVNPAWLENTHIVKNVAINPEGELEFDAAQTDIKIEPYKSFVAHSPNQQEYFQPVLDSIEYKPSALELVKPLVIFEGKNDFYTFKWMAKNLGSDITKNVGFYPGGGAGKNEKLIGLYLAWGRKFIIVMDADDAGNSAKTKYTERFGQIVNNLMFTLKDIEPDWDNLATEGLFANDDKLNIIQTQQPKIKKYSKKSFNSAISYCLMTDSNLKLSPQTKNNFKKALKFFDKKLEG